jgi:hypothetical protein
VHTIAPARRVALLFLLGGAVAFAQSILPVTSPTTLPPTPAAAPVYPPAAAPNPQRHADVVYAEGQLQITADNSSLNQILRDIGRLTGMKITGGVADQRVFGNYGPAPPARILANLLAGTGCNMLLQQTSSNVLEELVLTPQQGGPTPPNPNAPGFDDDAPVQAARPAYIQQVPPNQPQTPGSAPPFPYPGGQPPTPPSGTGNPADTNTPSTNPASPTGPQTPQQIYEQLQRLQRAQPPQ